jgi:integrase/recombinase XerD
MNTVGASTSKSFIRVDSLINNAIKHLETMGYKPGTIRNYRYTWNEFSQFASKNSEQNKFLTDLVSQFLNSFGIYPDEVQTGLIFRQLHIRNVMHVLTEFALNGCFHRRCHVVERTKLPDNMNKILSGYEQFCHDQLWSPSGTIRSRKRDITKFLHYLDSQGIKTVSEIHASTLSRFITSYSHLKPATLAHLVSSIRSFLRYLNMKGQIHKDLAEYVPKIPVRSDERIPSVWKQGDVDVLLAAVDRNSPCGKRDYRLR